MKVKDCCLIILTLLLFLAVILYYKKKPTIIEPSSDHVWVKIDPNSSRTYTTILMPKLNETYGRLEKLKVQHNWLKHRLHKCLEKLEAERGLAPIPRKYEMVLRGDPNLVDKYPEPPEPWFVPYEEPNIPSMLEEPDTSVRCLVGMMGIRAGSDRLYIDSSRYWIENFENRLKRLDLTMSHP